MAMPISHNTSLKFDLNQPQNGGVGHVRPGSGVPSAPPNMPGSQAKFVGEEQPWTANPSNQMKSKRVTVSTFWMDLTEVTRKDYKEFLETTGYRPPFIAEEWAEDGWNWNGVDYPEGTADHPVVMVSWYDAQEYCIWRGKRLPTEAEWQLGALGDVRLGNSFPWGKEYNHDNLNHGQIESPNFDDSDGFLYTSPVGAFSSGQSVYGLEDTFGNAWEFTADARRATWKFYDKADGETLETRWHLDPVCMSEYVEGPTSSIYDPIQVESAMSSSPKYVEKLLDFAVQSPKEHRTSSFCEPK